MPKFKIGVNRLISIQLFWRLFDEIVLRSLYSILPLTQDVKSPKQDRSLARYVKTGQLDQVIAVAF